MSVEVVLTNIFLGTGEGPHWDPKTKTLCMVDMTHEKHPNGRIILWNGSDVEIHSFENQNVTSVIPTRADHLNEFIVTVDQKIGLYNRQSKQFTKLAEVDQGKKTRFNDAKCDGRGRLWAGTMCLETSPGVTEEQGAGSLYSFTEMGGVQEQVKNLTLSNGIAWNKAMTRMYFIDSIPRHVYVYEFDEESGRTSQGTIFKDFSKLSVEEYGLPDGCCIDEDDNLWVALYNAAKVVCLNCETGHIIQEIHFPVKRTTSVCFGGDHFEDLFVTCGVIGMSEEELRSEPLAGSLFRVTGLKTKGLSPSCFTAAK